MGNFRLKRAFLLVDALHGLKRTDEEILALFRRLGVPHQVILSKVDRVLSPTAKIKSAAKIRANIEEKGPVLARIVEELRAKIQPGLGDGPEALGEVIACSAETALKKGRFGIDNVRWATLAATGLGDEKRWSVDLMQAPDEVDHSEKIVSEENLIVQDQV